MGLNFVEFNEETYISHPSLVVEYRRGYYTLCFLDWKDKIKEVERHLISSP